MEILKTNIFSITITSGSPQGIQNLVLNSYRLTLKYFSLKAVPKKFLKRCAVSYKYTGKFRFNY